MIDRTIVIHQDNIGPCLHIAVLESVIKNDQFNFRMGFAKFFDPFGPFFADGYGDFGILQFDLFGFVTDGAEGGLDGRKDKSPGFAFIATRQDGHFEDGGEFFDQKFGDRGFTGTADRQVTYANNRNIKLFAFEDIPIEEFVSNPDNQFIYPSQGGGPEFT